jgi:siroheme synthase
MSRRFGLPGRVFLVGSVSGSANSLTARALEILHRAEVVLHDDSVPADLLREVPKSSMVVDVGRATQEQITERMIAAADEGKVVARLRADAGSSSGSTQEESQALREAGIDFEVVSELSNTAAAAA